jgi:hypothetical protein
MGTLEAAFLFSMVHGKSSLLVLLRSRARDDVCLTVLGSCSRARNNSLTGGIIIVAHQGRDAACFHQAAASYWELLCQLYSPFIMHRSTLVS